MASVTGVKRVVGCAVAQRVVVKQKQLIAMVRLKMSTQFPPGVFGLSEW